MHARGRTRLVIDVSVNNLAHADDVLVRTRPRKGALGRLGAPLLLLLLCLSLILRGRDGLHFRPQCDIVVRLAVFPFVRCEQNARRVSPLAPP